MADEEQEDALSEEQAVEDSVFKEGFDEGYDSGFSAALEALVDYLQMTEAGIATGKVAFASDECPSAEEWPARRAAIAVGTVAYVRVRVKSEDFLAELDAASSSSEFGPN